jgi:hypothetical protein
VFTFAVETDELIQSEEKKLREQIQNLDDISLSVGKGQFLLKVQYVKNCLNLSTWNVKGIFSRKFYMLLLVPLDRY